MECAKLNFRSLKKHALCVLKLRKLTGSAGLRAGYGVELVQSKAGAGSRWSREKRWSWQRSGCLLRPFLSGAGACFEIKTLAKETTHVVQDGPLLAHKATLSLEDPECLGLNWTIAGPDMGQRDCQRD